MTSIAAIIGVIKQIWLRKSGFRPGSRFSGELDGGNVGKRILSLGRLAGVRGDARRVCRRRIMALQKSAEVEHGRLSPRRKEPGSLPGVCFPRGKVLHSLILLIVGELNRYKYLKRSVSRFHSRFTLNLLARLTPESILVFLLFNIVQIFLKCLKHAYKLSRRLLLVSSLA